MARRNEAVARKYQEVPSLIDTYGNGRRNDGHSGRLVGGAAGLGRLGLSHVVHIVLRAVDVLFEDGIGLVELKLRLELPDVVVDSAAVGPAAGLVEVEFFVVDFIANAAPITTDPSQNSSSSSWPEWLGVDGSEWVSE